MLCPAHSSHASGHRFQHVAAARGAFCPGAAQVLLGHTTARAPIPSTERIGFARGLAAIVNGAIYLRDLAGRIAVAIRVAAVGQPVTVVIEAVGATAGFRQCGLAVQKAEGAGLADVAGSVAAAVRTTARPRNGRAERRPAATTVRAGEGVCPVAVAAAEAVRGLAALYAVAVRSAAYAVLAVAGLTDAVAAHR